MWFSPEILEILWDSLDLMRFSDCFNAVVVHLPTLELVLNGGRITASFM